MTICLVARNGRFWTRPKQSAAAQSKNWRRGSNVRCESPGRKSATAVSADADDKTPHKQLKQRFTRSSDFSGRHAEPMALVEKKSKEVRTFVLRRGDYKSRTGRGSPGRRACSARLAGPAIVAASGEASASEPKTGRQRPCSMAGREPTDCSVIANRLSAASLRPRSSPRPAFSCARGEPPGAARLAGLGADRSTVGGRTRPTIA